MYGKLLRINLSTEQVSVEEIPEWVAKKFIGGEGINNWLLWEHFLKVDPRIDPKSPDNVMIIGNGNLAATAFGSGTKVKFTFKGTAYNMFADSVSGGTFGPAMRWAGYDYIVITGKASRPVYIWLDNNRVEIRDAGHLWGKGVFETQDTIKKELGDHQNVEIACIGPSGENQVSYASITVGGKRSAGRCGAGCVLGSKNLKAIAARGTRGFPIADPTAFFQAIDEYRRRLNTIPTIDNWRQFGTLTAPDFYNVIGSNHYRNCQENILPPDAISKLNGQAYFKTIYKRGVSCSPGCAAACSSEHVINGDETPEAKNWAGEHGDKPEYLTVSSFGMGCDVRDIASVAHWQKKCGDLALDILEIGNACGFIMELREKGILTEEDISQWIGEKVSASWGDSNFIEKAIESVAYQKNQFGQIFKDGVYQGARRIENIKGVPVLKYVVFGKGGSVINEEVRPFPVWAINMAVASRGCCHLKGLSWLDKSERRDISMAWFGRPEAGQGYSPALKGAGAARSENHITAINLLGICVFTGFFDPLILSLDVFARGYSAATGFPLTGEELYLAGERAYNLEKAFNSRLGLRREHDMLCERWLKEPTPHGPGKGMKVEDYFQQVLDEYYDYHGWDKSTGLQKRSKLEEIGLGDIIPVLEKDHAVV
ncbi:MAG: hypothetical protein HY730_01475 [Candidatus Tectomicrobia bacterium]|uniref:Aldehyde ferredoxin oxidoreductase N-terminal domain-containing protein n=1 Tax=Tectimicrobiota bacterium TaxID=2528274 RepID=A0A933GKW7_UNCTE|nr:hypothetical protein [Candidatus Tectomicrobia bacterium]